MKEKRRSIANVICFIFVLFFTFACSSLSFAADGDSLEVAKPSEGITLLKNESGEVHGINLNGNSVIIKDSDVSGKVNFFIDGNCNGVVDSGENAVALPDITGETTGTSKDVDVSENVTIYGLYNAVYNGELKISIEATSKISKLKGTYKSHLSGDLVINFKNSNIVDFKGLDYSKCDGDLSVLADNSSFTYFYAINADSSTKSEVGGDVSLNITKFKTGGSMSIIHGAYYADIKGNMTIDYDDEIVDNSVSPSFYGSYYANIDKNVEINCLIGNIGTFYGSLNSFLGGNINIDIGKNANIENSGNVGYLVGINAGGMEQCLSKKVDINIHDLSGKNSNLYGIYGYGSTTNLSSSDSVTVSLKNLKNFNYVYGSQHVSSAGNIKSTLENITANNDVYSSYYASCGGDIEDTVKNVITKRCVYGAWTPSCSGNIKETLTDIKGSYIAGAYGDSNSGGCGKDLEVTMSNCVHYLDNEITVYAAYRLTCGGVATINTTGLNAKYIYLAFGLSTGGGINATSKKDEITSGSQGTYYGTYDCSTGGAASVIIEDAKVENLYAGGVSAMEGSDVLFKDSEIHGQSVYASNTGNGTDTENIKISNVRFSNVKFFSAGENVTTIQNSVGRGTAAEAIIDDDCVLPEKYEIKAGKVYGNGYSSIKYKNNLYIGGHYSLTQSKLNGFDNVYAAGGEFTVEEDVKVKNMSFAVKGNYGDVNSLIISKGKTMEITNSFVENDMDIVLEGTFKANAETLAVGSASTVAWYINGGTSDAIRTEDVKYYPVDVTLPEYAATYVIYGIKKLYNTKDDNNWAKQNDYIQVEVTIDDGFHFVKGTFRGESETSLTDMNYIDRGSIRKYSFNMLDEKTYVDIVCEGNLLGFGNSVIDLLAKAKVIYTEENPLYDFSALVGDTEIEITNYEVAAGSSLPDGLYIKDGKILGEVTSANEGVDVNVIITAETGEKAVVTLKVVVEKADEDIEPINPENKEDEKKDDKNDARKSESGKTSKPVSTIKYGPAKGTKISDSKLIYKVTKVGSKGGKIVGEVEVVGIKNKKSKSVKIAASVTIDGVKYNVTSIGKKAFKGCKKLKKVTIGSNVRTIGASAFAKCKKLKKVTIKSKVLKKVAKGSFKGVKKSCKIKVPKAKKKAYKKMFKKAKCKAKIK